jgi:hypothetical protein
MSKRDDDLRVRPGRIRDKSFVGQATRAAKKAGHSGKRFGGGNKRGGSSTFGRGRRAAAARFLRSNAARLLSTLYFECLKHRRFFKPVDQLRE